MPQYDFSRLGARPTADTSSNPWNRAWSPFVIRPAESLRRATGSRDLVCIPPPFFFQWVKCNAKNFKFPLRRARARPPGKIKLLLDLSHQLGNPALRMAILGEGNASAKFSDDTFS